jgi:hypothetical protein
VIACGGSVTVSGRGWPPGTVVTVTFNHHTVATKTVAGNPSSARIGAARS